MYKWQVRKTERRTEWFVVCNIPIAGINWKKKKKTIELMVFFVIVLKLNLSINLVFYMNNASFDFCF